jgi:hypothetical protein
LLLRAGDLDRAETLAHSITSQRKQAEALAALAKQAQPARARLLVARAFRVGEWMTPLGALVQIQPAVLMAVADAFLYRD